MDKKHAVASVLLIAFALLVTGCKTPGPKARANDLPIPNAYRNAPEVLDNPSGNPSAPKPARSDWWRQYGSEELNALVDRALANNPELRTATLQIVQAKVRLEQARAGKLPSISAPIRLVGQGASSTTDTQQSTQASLQGSYRFDIWGEQQALVESAHMQLLRSVFERENVQRSVIANVVSTYIAYLIAGDSLRVAHENVKSAQDILHTVEQRFAAGDATDNEVEQQRAALFTQQATIPGLESQRDDSKTALARLLGTVSANVLLSEKGIDELQIPVLETSLPSTLLLRRPDIRMVEARMQSASANIEVARARLLPPLDFTTQFGYSSASLVQVLQPQNLFWNTATTLAVTIFDGGRREGENTIAQAAHEEMVIAYGQTVYQAIREVESALSNLRATSLRLEAQKQSLRASLHLFRNASEAYTLGSVDLTALHESRRNYQRYHDDTLRTKADVLRTYSTLAQALGSGTTLEETPRGQQQTPMALTVRQNADIIVANPGTSLRPGAWEAELPGLFHRSALLPVARDMRSRFETAVKDRAIRGAYQGGLAQDFQDPNTTESWYRLSVTGFGSRPDADAFCATLHQAQQACRVTPALDNTKRTARL